ncbi:MAG: arginine--tRNA ligase [Bdellovibrionales bacterium]|nr:arginine--tRNA ligase [Bdellovibrionales bacterium]
MERIKQDLAQVLSPLVSIDQSQIISLIEKPKKRQWGLLSLPVFSLHAKPNQFAQNLSKKIQADFISETTVVGGFLNFHFHSHYLQKIFNQTFSGESWWSSKKGEGKTWVVDYSSPNIAKYMNVGHLRATVIGQSLVNMARAQGYKVIALNHLGDWGTQFGKLIVAYQKWGSEISLPHLVDLYVRFHKETDDSLNQSARKVFKEMEEGKHLDLWSSFVKTSMDNYQVLWKRLGVQHDLVQGESFYRDKTKAVEELLKKKNILQESEGALVVFVDGDPPCLIRKGDGASTYACRDLASVFYRFENLKAEKNIYVTGVDHTLHFRQLKKVLTKVHPNWAENTIHLPFGMYRFKGKGKLSSRQGQSVSLAELMDESISMVLKIIKEKNPSLEDKEKVAEMVGLGALVFNDLMNDRVKDVDFSWDKILDFEGDSGPYVQYCHVRCASLIQKTGAKEEWKALSVQNELEDLELRLIEVLLDFETKLNQAFHKYSPHILSSYLLELCRVFNQFYAKYRIIDSPNMEFRVELVKVVKRVLNRGLWLLNIKSPEAM